MYHLSYILIGDIVRHHRIFTYKEDMELFIKRLNPTSELLFWEEK